MIGFWAGWVSYKPHIGNVDWGMLVRNMLTIVNFSQLVYDEKICSDVATMTEPDYFIPLRIGQV